jgi:hypothetical protein
MSSLPLSENSFFALFTAPDAIKTRAADDAIIFLSVLICEIIIYGC